MCKFIKSLLKIFGELNFDKWAQYFLFFFPFSVIRKTVGIGTSFILSSVLSIVLFCGMQIYRHWLASSALHTIFGGYLSSLLFVLILTAVGNIETALFGKAFQTKLFPEVFTCLMLGVFAASMIHRVCITTCVLFSMASLYYMNKLSQMAYTVPVVVQNVQGKKKKGN